MSCSIQTVLITGGKFDQSNVALKRNDPRIRREASLDMFGRFRAAHCENSGRLYFVK